MKDITQRLEDLGGKLISYSHPWSEWAQCVLVAKSEIESLRADNDRLREAYDLAVDAAQLALRTAEWRVHNHRERVLTKLDRASAALAKAAGS